jgi:multiple sugar transport system substrate-binding protein/arabinosaccharide transport system substrate-binding protein
MSKKGFTRREFLNLSAAVAAGALLVACQATPSPTVAPTEAPTAEPATATPVPEPTKPKEKEKVNIALWTHDALYVQFFQSRAPEWAEMHPEYDFTFDIQQVPDAQNKILAAFAAGEPVPDLFGIISGVNFSTFMKDDLIGQKFVDLTPLVGDDRPKFVENTWSKYSANGKIYSIESALCTTAFYYQPTVLEAVGGKEFPGTWDDFRKLGLEAAKKDVYLSAVDVEGNGTFNIMFMQRGGMFFDENNKFVLGESPNKDIAIEVLEYLKDGIDNKIWWPASNADFWGPPLFAAQGEGKVMGLPSADWWSDFMLKAMAEDQAGKWRLALMPKWTGGGYSAGVFGGTGFSITKESKHPDLAWDFLHYAYMNKENQLKRFEEITYLPTMIEALNDPRFTGKTDPYYGDQVIGEVWSEAAQDMPLTYPSPVYADMNNEFNVQCANVYAGKTKAADAVDAVVAKTKQAIADL